MQLVYMGFTQQANLRCFHFERILAKGGLANLPKIAQFTLKADMALFTQHHVPVQEGPAICLRILTDTLSASGENELPSSSFAVTTEHLSIFVSARTSIAEAKAARRKPRVPFKPSNSSQLKLPPRIQ
jgi:hypothetical protein